eukprot:11216299-Lingulodinium_polyedra.AAC.1
MSTRASGPNSAARMPISGEPASTPGPSVSRRRRRRRICRACRVWPFRPRQQGWCRRAVAGRE